jgi:hypothetical protein
MKQMLSEADWLLDSRNGLVRLKIEADLTPTEIATVDVAIAALDSLFHQLAAS